MINENLIYVGIDLHKESHTAVIIDCYNKKLGEITFANTPAEFPKLVRKVKKYCTDGKEVVYGLENAYGYGRALAVWLLDKGYAVKDVNTAISNRQAKHRGAMYRKSDSDDASAIALATLNMLNKLPDACPNDAYWSLGQLVHRRDNIMKHRTRLVNQLHEQLCIAYPSYKVFFTDISRPTALYFWEHYPSRKYLRGKSVDDLREELVPISHNRCSTNSCKKILDAIAGDKVKDNDFQDMRDMVTLGIVSDIKHYGNTTYYTYDGNGNLTETKDAAKRVFYSKYDILNRVVETGMRSPLEPEKDIVLTRTSYSIENHQVTETDAVNGGSITTTYDEAGRPVKTMDDKGNTLSETIYDTEGRVLQTVDALGCVSENVYNSLMQIEKVRTGQKGTLSGGIYTLTGEIRETAYTYDDLGRTTKVTDSESGVSSVVFDSLGRITSMKDPNQNALENKNSVNTYTYLYNEQGLLEQETNAIGNTTTYQYNSELLLEKMTDSENETTKYTYDSLNRLKTVSDELGTIRYTYDKNGNITEVSEKEKGMFGVTKTICREFDSLNRVIKYTDYKGREVKYAYDALGNMVALTYPGGEIVKYTYHADGNVASMTSNSGGTYYYTYDSYGRLSKIKRPDGSVESRVYDNAGNLTEQVDTDKNGEILQKNHYDYNVFGEVVTKTTSNANIPTVETIKMTYNAANRLETYNGQKVEYDKKGNMTYGPVDGTMQELTYDCRNRLIEAGGVSYTYDAENTRIATTKDGKTTEYVTDTGGSLSKLLTAYETDGTETDYYYGAEGLEAQYNSGTKEYLNYHYDNIGSTTLITDADGKEVERFSYGTYGELLSIVENKIRFLYNGAYGVVTDENGLYYMRARYYNSDIKRFINQDIKVGDIGSSQSLNRYAYCEGNPVNMIDPFGLSPESSQDQGTKSKYAFWHGLLDVAGLFFDGADIVNAALYAMEGNWVMAATSIACALPVIGTAVAGVTKATKLVKAGKVIEKTLQVAGKLYATIESAKTALELAGDAKMEYAVNGGKMTLGVAAKMVGAVAMAGISMLTAGSLMKDVTSLSKVSNIDMNTKTQQTADAESGKCPKGEGIGCFVAGTKVKTEDGEKNIEDVETGDYVLAENPENGEQGYKDVVRTYIYEKTTIVHVFVGEEEIETTVEHPFYVEGVGFVSAGELKAGDIIRTSEGKNLPIDKIEIEELEEPVLVYNFEVEDFHTYYVSDLGVLVHNTCGDTTVGEGGSNPIKPFEVTTYKDFTVRSVVGDGIEGHEMWQHANLKQNGYATTRMSTPVSKNNPVMALPHDIHVDVNRQQALFDGKNQTPFDNIIYNANIMYNNKDIPNEQVTKHLIEALKHLDDIGGN